MLKPALLIIAGRIAGFVAAFVTPLILVRMFDLETFGTYKQWFLLYITLLTMTQIGMSESLLYFLPRADGEAGRYVMNSVAVPDRRRRGGGRGAGAQCGGDRPMDEQSRPGTAHPLARALSLVDAGVHRTGNGDDGAQRLQVGGGRLCGHRPDPGALSHRAGAALRRRCARCCYGAVAFAVLRFALYGTLFLADVRSQFSA